MSGAVTGWGAGAEPADIEDASFDDLIEPM
jgi:hypothetical protein